MCPPPLFNSHQPDQPVNRPQLFLQGRCLSQPVPRLPLHLANAQIRHQHPQATLQRDFRTAINTHPDLRRREAREIIVSCSGSGPKEIKNLDSVAAEGPLPADRESSPEQAGGGSKITLYSPSPSSMSPEFQRRMPVC